MRSDHLSKHVKIHLKKGNTEKQASETKTINNESEKQDL